MKESHKNLIFKSRRTLEISGVDGIFILQFRDFHIPTNFAVYPYKFCGLSLQILRFIPTNVFTISRDICYDRAVYPYIMQILCSDNIARSVWP